MLMNNLDSEVGRAAGGPRGHYGGIGKAARTWGDFDRITAGRCAGWRATRRCWCQSGKPVGVFRTHAGRAASADREFQSGATLGRLAPFRRARPQGPDDVRPDDRGQLDLYRQAREGSSRAPTRRSAGGGGEAGRRHYGGSLGGRWILTAGWAAWAGRSPLAAAFSGACCLAVECDPDRIEMRRRTRYPTTATDSLDDALAMIERWTAAGRRSRSGSWQAAGGGAGAGPPAASVPIRHRPDPARTIRSTAICRWLGARRMAREAGERPGRGRGGRPPFDCAPMSRRW